MFEQSPDNRLVLMHGRESTYAMGVTDDGRWVSLFWGARIHLTDVFASGTPSHHALIGPEDEEFPGWEGLRYREPALKVTFADGVRDVRPRHQRHFIREDGVLEVLLADDQYGLTARLMYRMVEQWDLIERTVVLANHGRNAVTIEQALTGALHLAWQPAYRLTHLAGRWGGETQRQRQDLTLGKFVLESRLGHTGLCHAPWIAIDDGQATEDQGEVWCAALAWSGNWKIVIEHEAPGHLRCAAGMNDFDFAFRLDHGEEWTLPSLLVGYSPRGFGQMSRQLHAYQRAEILPARFARTIRPVIYNSWYATQFEVTEENQRLLADRAAALGVELFVIDDGWFARRDSDRTGLGDWWVSPTKFPHGLAPLIDHVRGLGMDFGLWVEPEMVNPDSDLYRAHPDWVYHFPNRPRTESRHQLVLNLARREVEEYILTQLNDLLSRHEIRFLKWDYNRAWSEPGWPDAPEGREREGWVRHVDALYRILVTLRQLHPDVLIESCASGGGRVDLGILRYTDQVWTSDNVFAQDRLTIQEGFSYAYTAKTMVAWVTDNESGRLAPLSYRFHVAMQGVLGIGGNLRVWEDADLAEARAWVTLYKEIRQIVQDGHLYRLLSPSESGDAAVWYTARDGRAGVAFVYRTSVPPWAAPVRLKLPGLQDGTYLVHHPDGTTETHSAGGLASVGVMVPLFGDFVSVILRVSPAP